MLDLDKESTVSVIVFNNGKIDCSCIYKKHVIVEIIFDDFKRYDYYDTYITTVANVSKNLI